MPSGALARWRRLLPGLWAGWLLCVALLAAAAPFATLAPEIAGRVVARVLAHEAYSALLLGVLLFLLEQRAAARQPGSRFSSAMLLCVGALFCTVAGYFALQPMMVQARAGVGALSFGQLHALSAGFYLVKLGLVLVLAWRAAGPVAAADAALRPAPSS